MSQELESNLFSSVDQIQTKLYKAGFYPTEVTLIITGSTNIMSGEFAETIAKMPIGFFTFIRRNIDYSARAYVLRGFFNDLKQSESREPITDLLMDVYKMSFSKPKLEKDLSNLANLLVKDDSSIAWYESKFRLGLQVLTDPDIFEIFSSDINRFVEFANAGMHSHDFSWEALGLVLKNLRHNPNKNLFLNGLNESALLRIASIPQYDRHKQIGDLLKKKKLAQKANELLVKDRDWYEKLLLLPKTIESMGVSVVKSEIYEDNLLNDLAANYARSRNLDHKNVKASLDLLSNEEKFKIIQNEASKKNTFGLLSKYKEKIKKSIPEYEVATNDELNRIKKRENPNHPLITLDISRKVGYEIEFKRDQFTRPIAKTGLFEILAIAGFKPGIGDDSSYETSPGPFYDPLTAKSVFRVYYDAGILNINKYKSFTYHFNLDIGNNPKFAISLVRAMYLTGSAYDARYEFRESAVRIYENEINRQKFVECKTFDVVTKEGFEWNMYSAGMLAWAVDAYRKVRNSEAKVTGWHMELNSIWNEYIQILNSGLSSIGLWGQIYESVHTKKANTVREQINLIFPTKYSRYQDLSKIEGEGILQIKHGKKIWPNLAYFAREVTNEAVAKIEALANNLEDEVREDIQKIEKAGAGFKKPLMREFCDKYNSSSYEVVRDLFLGA